MDQVRENILSEFGESAAAYYDKHFGPDKMIEFDGMNCNDFAEEDYCDGWDGISRRCSCGNRRVDWVWEPMTELSCFAGILYAEAY